mgnify:CR=1 FL=1
MKNLFQNNSIAFGNIIGSNIFNLFAILGVAGLITPLIVRSSTVWKEIPFSFLAALLLLLLTSGVFSQDRVLSRMDGSILLVFFCSFIYYVFQQLKRENKPPEPGRKELPNFKIWMFIFFGFSFLFAGGRFVVVNSVQIATDLGISQTIVGVTIVAAGTSLPELAASTVAAAKKNSDIAIGNIIGSNIFNIFFILGVSSLIRPLEYNTKFNFGLYLLCFGTILLFTAMFSGKKKRLDRWEAGILLAIYIGYILFLISREM